jgi:glycosyltransferase involved in cell wall biosynthesis
MSEVIAAAYILAKNEELNIERALAPLRTCGVRTIVLNSYSTDRTVEICQAYGAEVEDYNFKGHEEAYRYLCEDRHPPGTVILILDADMAVSQALLDEGLRLLKTTSAQVVRAPIQMYWEGQPMRAGSLYPPYAFMFRTGRSYFEPKGHHVVLRSGVRHVLTKNTLIHNDCKSYEVYLTTQVRHAKTMLRKQKDRALTWRDWIRVKSPLLVFITPLASLLLKGGVRTGRIGIIYAIDRLIAEAIMYRTRLALDEQEERAGNSPQ